MEHSPILSDPEIMSGAPCFRGTRVLARTLFDYLETGHTLTDFFVDFPSVTREQVTDTFRSAQELLLAKRS